MELGPVRPLLARFARPDTTGTYAHPSEPMVELLEDAARVVTERANRLGDQSRRKHTPTVGDPAIIVIVDEMADLGAYLKGDLGNRATRAIQRITSQGRAPGRDAGRRRAGPPQGDPAVPAPVPRQGRPAVHRRRRRPRPRQGRHRPGRGLREHPRLPPRRRLRPPRRPARPHPGPGRATSPTTTSPGSSPPTAAPPTPPSSRARRWRPDGPPRPRAPRPLPPRLVPDLGRPPTATATATATATDGDEFLYALVGAVLGLLAALVTLVAAIVRRPALAAAFVLPAAVALPSLPSPGRSGRLAVGRPVLAGAV